MAIADPDDLFKGLITTPSGGWIGRFLCRHGRHKWQFLWMKDKRMVSAGVYSEWICTLSDSCRRPHCRIRRVRENVKVPKRVRM